MTTATKAGGAVLKPCPFCGNTDSLLVEHLQGTVLHPAYRVHCDNCGASSNFTSNDHIASWNTRAPAQATIDELRAEVERLTRERDEAAQDLAALRAFTGEVMGGWPEVGGLDGFDLQAIGEKTGLLRRETRVASCGEQCACVEFDSGEVECWRVEPVLQRAREALRAELMKDRK